MTGRARIYGLTLAELAGCVMSGRPKISGSTGATAAVEAVGTGASTFGAAEEGEATTGAAASTGAGNAGAGAAVGIGAGTGSGALTTSLDFTGVVCTTVFR